MRPAGVLIPEGAGQRVLQAGYGQIEAQVMKVGMVAEATCISKPWMVIPMVVTGVQNYIAAGQFRGGDQLVDAQNAGRPGTILVLLEPLYEGGLDDVTPGSSCIANAYTSNHDVIADKETGACAASPCTRSMPWAWCTPCCCGFRRWCFPCRPWCWPDIEPTMPNPGIALTRPRAAPPRRRHAARR